MDDDKLLKLLKKRKPKALEMTIQRYTPFVSTIVYNIIGRSMTMMDVEEVTADVFFALWEHSSVIAPGKLKSYLGAIARNKAKTKLRDCHAVLSLDEDCIDVPDESFEWGVLKTEDAKVLFQAVEDMGMPYREIFLRYYYYYQTTGQIAEDMKLNKSTVQTYLHRGRQKLKENLLEGGFVYEG